MKPYFISYSRVDREYVRQIESLFCEELIPYFLDEKDIEWGDDVDARITDAINESQAIIVVISPG